MATPKKAATAKKTTPASKAVKPTAKPAAKKAAPVKKADPKPAAKKAAAPVAKKAAPVAAKKAAPAAAKKVVAPVKAASAKGTVKSASTAKAAPAVKSAAKSAPPAKKVVETKKATPAVVKKSASGSSTPTKAAAKAAPKAAEVKSSTKATAPSKPAAPAKVAAPAKPAAPAKAVKAAKPVKKVIIKASSLGMPKAKVPARAPEPEQKVAPPPFKKAAPPPPPRPTKVVIPEIKTKTSQKYEPDFTKSVLDTNPIPQNGPTMRYSDAELVEFRELIQKKMDAARKELNYLQGLITRKDEMGGDESESRYMTMEDGSVSMEREQLAQMASRQITFIDHLEKALMRIESKTYGICRVTGKLIDKARLRAVPHATLSIEAKQMMNK